MFNWQESENSIKKAYKIEISEVSDENGDGAIDLTDVEYLLKNNKNTLTTLDGNGDFRSQECIELLKKDYFGYPQGIIHLNFIDL